jgi:hypothetical protein
MAAMNSGTSDWALIEPLLDEGMETLDETDRSAILLRYFQNKSLREVGETLGTNEDAAQKRVGRAVERLREFFTKRGVTIGVGGLVAVISAHAVQAAPAGLAAAISFAAVITGTTVATATTTATITKAIAMTAIQKTLITATIVAAVGTGIYEARQASTFRNEVESLKQRQAPLAAQVEQLARERDDATRQVAALRDDNERLTHDTTELLKLRSEISRLRSDSQTLAQLKMTGSTNAINNSENALRSVKPWQLREPRRVNEFENVGRETPEAAAETVLWAAYYRPRDIADMVLLPPDLAKDEYSRTTIAEQLAKEIVRGTEAIQGESKQVWLDGGNKTTFNSPQQPDGKTYQYNNVLLFRLTGRPDVNDPGKDHFNDMVFAKIDGMWKLVIPGLSPEIE